VVLTAIGIVLGLGLSALLGRVLSGMLFGVSGHDPAVFVTAAAALSAASLLASYIPARRAMRVAPLMAIRGD
jgi:putative ABC transport system permease protein